MRGRGAGGVCRICRLCLGADDDGDHALRLEHAGEGGFDVAGADLLDLACPGVQVVARQAVPGDVGNLGQKAGVAVHAQGEAADEVVFGGLELGLGGALPHKVLQHLPGHLHSLVGLVGAGLQADGEGAGVQGGLEALLYSRLYRQGARKYRRAHPLQKYYEIGRASCRERV